MEKKMKNIIQVLIIAGILSFHVQATEETNLSYEQLLMQYIQWAGGIEREGASIGKPLSQRDLMLAREIGIEAPEKVRVIYVDEVPYPYENPALKAMGKSLGLIGADIVNQAQVFGYSIYVRKDYELDRPRMAHELVHVLQIERASFAEVVIQHVSDMSKYSYENAPLEVEAFKANKKYAIK